MCGITAILCGRGVPASPSLYEALLALQHRGQDAAGIVTEDEGRLCLRKGNGMVRDVFQQESMEKLTGEMGIAHCRYPTAGTSSCAAAASGRCNVCSSCCRGWLDSPAMNAVRCLLVH